VDDFVREKEIKKFIMEEIDDLLNDYKEGTPENKPDVLKQIQDLKEKREKIELEMREKQTQQYYQNLLTQQYQMNQQLVEENKVLKEKVDYLNKKIKEIIEKSIQDKNNK
jgi:hypothetical protein